MRIIGDVHGLIPDYLNLRAHADESIQIGDMGLGFKGVALPPSREHRFFRGNHDSPQACREHESYMGDWGYDAAKSLFWFSGADSIDRHLRREGVSWWRDEQLSGGEFQEALDLYEQVKPRIVLSHDGPQAFIEAAFHIDARSLTRQALQRAYELWQPSIWVFGHHHRKFDYVSPEGTHFVCLPEMGFMDINLPLWPETTIGTAEQHRLKEQQFREMFDNAMAAVQGIVDMPDRRANLLVRLCLQNEGRLSASKRKHYSELTDEEVRRMEEAVREVKDKAEVVDLVNHT